MKIQQVVARSYVQEMTTIVVHCNPIKGLKEFVYTNSLYCGIVPLSDNTTEPIDSLKYVSSSLEGSEPIY